MRSASLGGCALPRCDNSRNLRPLAPGTAERRRPTRFAGGGRWASRCRSFSDFGPLSDRFRDGFTRSLRQAHLAFEVAFGRLSSVVRAEKRSGSSAAVGCDAPFDKIELEGRISCRRPVQPTNSRQPSRKNNPAYNNNDTPRPRIRATYPRSCRIGRARLNAIASSALEPTSDA